MNEATLKCEIYRQLKNLGYEVKSEIRLSSIVKGGTNKDVMDLIVYEDNKITLIIETKTKWKNSWFVTKDSAYTKQLKKYIEHGYPIFVCVSIEHLGRILAFLKYKR